MCVISTELQVLYRPGEISHLPVVMSYDLWHKIPFCSLVCLCYKGKGSVEISTLAQSSLMAGSEVKGHRLATVIHMYPISCRMRLDPLLCETLSFRTVGSHTMWAW